MNILVCYKLVPDARDIEVKADGTIFLGKAEWNIGQYDLNAVEAGVSLAEETGGKTIALSIGSSQLINSKARKDILSRGPEELYLVIDDCLEGADTNLTARTIAAVVKKLSDVDLVICGEGSSDLYFQQVGLQVGELLDWPTTNSVTKIEIGDRGLVIERTLEQDVEILDVPLPAVLSVTTDINQPRLPSMKEILRAGKKPVTEWSVSDLTVEGDLENQVEVLSINAPPTVDRKQIMISGSSEEMVGQLISYLSKEGVL